MRAAPRVPSAIVDFGRLKAEVARLYPPGHPFGKSCPASWSSRGGRRAWPRWNSSSASSSPRGPTDAPRSAHGNAPPPLSHRAAGP